MYTQNFARNSNSWKVRKLFKSLYGLSEAGDSWFYKYIDFVMNELDISTTDGDL